MKNSNRTQAIRIRNQNQKHFDSPDTKNPQEYVVVTMVQMHSTTYKFHRMRDTDDTVITGGQITHSVQGTVNTGHSTKSLRCSVWYETCDQKHTIHTLYPYTSHNRSNSRHMKSDLAFSLFDGLICSAKQCMVIYLAVYVYEDNLETYK